MSTAVITGLVVLVLIDLAVINMILVYMVSKQSQTPQAPAIPKDSPNPLFKLTLPEMEAYLSSVLVHELTFIIESDISIQDPNMTDELYGRLLVNVTAFFVDYLDEFEKRLGPNYLTNFITHSFHRLRVDGALAKLISNNALR